MGRNPIAAYAYALIFNKLGLKFEVNIMLSDLRFLLSHQQGKEDLQKTDKKPQRGADHFHEPEFFCEDLV
jgi:hypothetical protein